MTPPRRIVVIVLALLVTISARAQESAKKPWQRLLQDDDARTATELEKKLGTLQEQGKFTDALPLAEALAELRAGRQSADHWQAVTARFDVEAIRRVLRQTEETQKEYAGVFALRTQADTLEQKGRFKEAQPLQEKALAITRKALGDEHPDTAQAYKKLGFNLMSQGKYAPAEEGLARALRLRRKLLGEDHPDTAGSYNSIALNLKDQGKYGEAEDGYRKALDLCLRVHGPEHADTATGYNNMATNLHGQARYSEADELFRKALELNRKLHGEKHRTTALCYNNLAVNQNAQANYADAEIGYRKALEIRREVLGEDHPLTAQSYNNAAFNLNAQGKYREADAGYRKALDIFRRVLGEEHPDTSLAYNNVAFNLNAQGKYVEAEVGYLKALNIRRKVLGEEHPSTATSYANAAANLTAQGKYAEAEEGLRTSLKVRRKVLGENHPETAAGYNNLASNLNSQGKLDEAEQGYRKALDILRTVVGENHPNTAGAYSNVAGVLKALRKYDAADEYYRKALAIKQKVLGEDHPDTALGYGAVGNNLHSQGKHDEAVEYVRKALDIRRRMLGEDHPHTAVAYSNLAANLYARGKYEEAEASWTLAADRFLANRFRIAASGLERAAVTTESSGLAFLPGALARNQKPEAAWERFEQSLARGTWDDLAGRLRRPEAERARQFELGARLARLDQLLEKTLSMKDANERKKLRTELLDRRLKALEEYHQFSSHLEKTYGPAAGQVLERKVIQAALPADTALVGWVDIAGLPGAHDPDGEHWAVLLRSTGLPVWIRLRGTGTKDAWTADDARLPEKLRSALQEPRGSWQPLAEQLRKQRLQPLEKHLAAGDGLPAVKRLVVLPSTALVGVPVEVFADGFTVSYANSGTFYAHLRKQPKVETKGLFAVGDPIFDRVTENEKPPPLPQSGVLLTVVAPGSSAAQAGIKPNDVLLRYHETDLSKPADLKPLPESDDPAKRVAVLIWRDGRTMERQVRPGKLGIVMAGEPAPKALAELWKLDRRLATTSRGGDKEWPQLPGTRVEVEALQRNFGSDAPPRLLFDGLASEQELYALAKAGELGKYRYIHLATHGEFDDRFPLRSAIILSRDALPDAGKQLDAGLPAYDGRLTAEEVLREWNLRCELVTLSACQTALGKYERGEGFVGFAQSLLLCGSRSVCLSHWKVDDAATALLMDRFYQNLLGKREGLQSPMPKAVALAEAKDWLRKLSRDEALKRTAQLSNGVVRGKNRPALPQIAPPPMSPAMKDTPPYAHPYYWAAFVLIGDPE